MYKKMEYGVAAHPPKAYVLKAGTQQGIGVRGGAWWEVLDHCECALQGDYRTLVSSSFFP